MNLLNLVVPLRCAGCGAPDFEACPSCVASFGPPVDVRVPGVGPPVYALADYHGAARELVLAFKERGRRALAAWFGAFVAVALPMLAPRPWTLVPAPSTPRAARLRGGSHMVRIAESVHGATVAPVLRLANGVRDSVGLDASARDANLRGRLSVRRAPPSGPVVLLDDVVTSGATARACVAALAASRVDVAAVLVLTAAVGLH
ncbi:hypothetical protein Lesp02_79260 [Lentzea sp. NBRC 105346]|uniref:ComF family protein n=1 Tax=Lentzea sp. NBRC 105346 TaxID=3032205 RepID=UPI0024A4A886|nr:phosphoribosyltransferase [Lentzea sp. NBRC 105346]GLZ35739.1 hypothetical protein Lesp02_79260 [Lentzea sp. NBRC 105346]